jgi:hypothetical protein
MDLNGKSPLVDAAADWVREAVPTSRRASSASSSSLSSPPSSERQRVRRRVRRGSIVRARVQRRILFACLGALLLMGTIIYFVLQHDGASVDRQPPPPRATALGARRA